MDNVKLSSPWVTYYRKIAELFRQDKDISLSYVEDNKSIYVYVNKQDKADALSKLLPTERDFGGVKVKTYILYRTPKNETLEDIYKKAFEGNPALSYTFTAQTDTNPITYVVMEKKVVQYWNDDLSDPHGITSTLYENIAKDVFKDNGVIYSTDSELENQRLKNKKIYSATKEEIAEWEKYNGKGSFFDGSSPKNCQKPVPVNDMKTFKSIFEKDNEQKDEVRNYPF